MTTIANAPGRAARGSVLPGAIGALGIVFGDIGTSPLYALKAALGVTGATDPATVLGVVSLFIWTLIVVTSLKYATVAMCFDNDGEGGILALMSLLGSKVRARPLIVMAGLFGAALIYGDGAITPAISVLSALEGVDSIAPKFEPLVMPLTIVILVALFAAQISGTARIGRAFGPVMVVWFVAAAALGLRGIAQYPAVIKAVNPAYAIHLLLHRGGVGFLVLGGVFLCATGAEALYADMGHFGRGPIRVAWAALVFPSMLLNYMGQGAAVLAGASPSANLFYLLCPHALTVPLIVLATLATIIASQSIITGAFSMTRQAIQLGWMPRMQIVQTSDQGYGQIYVAPVNWILMLITVALVFTFRKSDNLASAYGIAVSTTMLLTTILLYLALREVWQWGRLRSGSIAGLFLLIDGAFFCSNAAKLLSGGYVPILIAGIVFAIMCIWHFGVRAIEKRLGENPIPIQDVIGWNEKRPVHRVPGTAVFLGWRQGNVPSVLRWYVETAQSLQQTVVALTLTQVTSAPRVSPEQRAEVIELGPGAWAVTARYGYYEHPDIPSLIDHLVASGLPLDLSCITYFDAALRVTPRDAHPRLPRLVTEIFSVQLHLGTRLTDYVRIPPEKVVQFGKMIGI